MAGWGQQIAYVNHINRRWHTLSVTHFIELLLRYSWEFGRIWREITGLYPTVFIRKLEKVNHRIISLEIIYVGKGLGQVLNNFAGCLMVCYSMVTLKLHSIASHCLRHLNVLKHCTVVQLCSCIGTGKTDLV